MTRPMVWIGCQHCRLRHVPVELARVDADEVETPPETVATYDDHDLPVCRECGEDGLRVLEYEYLPVTLETPAALEDVQDIVDEMERIDSTLWPALLEHARLFDQFDVDEFQQDYRGEWRSLEEYAYEQAEEQGWLDVLEEAGARRNWFDVQCYADDLEQGGVMTVDSPNGVYVFDP